MDATQLQQCIPAKNISAWTDAILAAMETFEINTPERQAAFLAQCGHESNNLVEIVENLNYRESGLLATFPTHFTSDEASSYAHQPEKIANRAYANRMGNGNEASGDGWRYRGRGLIQLTGKNNYTSCSREVNGNDLFVSNPDLLAQPVGAVLSAAWFWKKNNCNSIADSGDFVRLTRVINGGTNGLDDRIVRWNHCKQVLGI